MPEARTERKLRKLRERHQIRPSAEIQVRGITRVTRKKRRMDKATVDRVVHAIDVWAERQPSPDDPAIALGDQVFSPRQLASEVKEHTPAGDLFLKIVENGLQEFPLDDIIHGFLGVSIAKARSG
jgi:hypothetical protein